MPPPSHHPPSSRSTSHPHPTGWNAPPTRLRPGISNLQHLVVTIPNEYKLGHPLSGCLVVPTHHKLKQDKLRKALAAAKHSAPPQSQPTSKPPASSSSHVAPRAPVTHCYQLRHIETTLAHQDQPGLEMHVPCHSLRMCA